MVPKLFRLRSIPSPPFEKIEFSPTILFPWLFPRTTTPESWLLAMTFPEPRAPPPTRLDKESAIATPSLPLPNATVPVASVPMRLPRTIVLLAGPMMMTPLPLLAARTFPPPDSVKPTTLPTPALTLTPAPLLPRAAVPAASVPM